MSVVTPGPAVSRLPRASLHTISWRYLPLPLLAVVAFLLGLAAGPNPALLIGGCAGAIFVGIMLANLTAGLMCFGLVAFFEVLPGVGGGLSAAKLAGTLVALSWLGTIVVRTHVRRGFFATYPVTGYTGVALISWMVLSLTWGHDVSAGLTAVSRYGLDLALLPIVFAAIRTRRDVFWLVGILVLGASLSALFGIVFARGDALAEGTSRLGGAGVDSNYLATVLVASIVLSVALATIRTLPVPLRLGACGATVLGLVALIDTVSRAGMVGLVAVGLIGIACAGRGRRLLLATVALLIAVSVAGFYVSVASPAARDRILSFQGGGSGRNDIWAVGWRMVQANPVTGVGVGNFPNRTVDYLFQPGVLTHSKFIVDEPKVAHNIYLEILAEVGVVGLGLFLGLLAFLVSCALRAAKEFRDQGDRPMELISRALVVAPLGMLVTDFFSSDQFSKPLWIQLALCPCLLAIARRSSPPMHQLSEPQLVPGRV